VRFALEKVKEKGVLTILITDLPPFSFIDTKTGQPAGIDIEILNEFAKEIGVNKIQVKVVDTFPELFEKLNTDDSIDVAASGIIITDKRKELVAFTQPLYKESEAIIVPKVSRINFKEDLKNAVVGVQLGTVYDDLAKKWQKDGKIKDIKTFENINLVLSAIMERKVDAGLIDSVTGEYLLFKNNLYLKTLKPYTAENVEVIGIAVRKNDVT
jgi:polar amino acid transport system substrate-binding protein